MFGVPNCVDKDRVSTYQKSIGSTDIHKTLTFAMTDGETLRQFIDSQHKTKKSIYTALSISKQSFFQYFQSQVLSDDVKQRFEDYFGKKIFTEESKHRVSTYSNKAKKPELSNEDLFVTIRELSESTNRHSIIDERNSRNIERLLDLVFNKLNLTVTSKTQEETFGPEGTPDGPGFQVPSGKGAKGKPKDKH